MDKTTVHLDVRQRSLLSRIVRLPFVFRKHYRILRTANGVIVSAYGAWLLAGLVVSVKRAA